MTDRVPILEMDRTIYAFWHCTNLIVRTLTVDRREAESNQIYSQVELAESSVTPVIEPLTQRLLDTHAGTMESGPGMDGDVRREGGTVRQTGYTVFVDFERLHDVISCHVLEQNKNLKYRGFLCTPVTRDGDGSVGLSWATSLSDEAGDSSYTESWLICKYMSIILHFNVGNSPGNIMMQNAHSNLYKLL